MKNRITSLIIFFVLLGTTELYSQFWVKYYFTDSTYVPQVDKTYNESGVKLTSQNEEYRTFLDSFVFSSFSPNKWLEEEEDFISHNPWNFAYIKICEYTFTTREQKYQFVNAMGRYRDAYIFFDEDNAEVIWCDDTTTLIDDTIQDPFYLSYQDYLRTIKCEEAWNFIVGNNILLDSVNVGVVDANFSDHEDLYIKELLGSNDSLNFHGNNVVGCLGAKTFNQIGIASPSFNTARIYAYANDSKNTDTLFHEIKRLVDDRDCKIVNCSWATKSFNNKLMDLLEYCLSKDCLIICSAGNSNSDTAFYPASYHGCMSVTSVDCSQENFGNHINISTNKCHSHNTKVDISAPGYNICTTGRGYHYYDINKTGTSFSAPLVASIATLVRAVNPCLTANEVIDVLKSTANDTIYRIEANQPYIGMLGTGLVDAYQAVKKAYELSLPLVYIRDSQQDDGTEPYPGRDYTDSPDIIVRNEDGSPFLGNLSSMHDDYLLDVIIRKFGCNYQTNENTKLIVTVDAPSLFSRFTSNNSFFCSRIFETTNIGFNISSGVTVDSIVIEGINFHAPEAFWGFHIDENLSSRFCADLPLEHVKMGFNIMAIVDEDGSASHYLSTRFRNDKYYVKTHRNAAMKKGRETINMDKYIHIAQLTPNEIPSSLVIRQMCQSDSTILSDNAEIYFWVSDSLIPYIDNIDNLEFVDENRILITNRNTEISFLPTYNPENDYYFIGLEVHFFGDEEPQHSIYDVDIELVEEGEVSDILTFTAIRDESVYFSAVASTSSNEIMNTQATTLSSNTISEEASYTWFDAAMDTIGSGRQLTVQPNRSQTYTLKIQQSNNGYVASDTVSVRVLDGRITTITPNPATSLTVIAYEVTENKSANITITDVSNTIRQTYPLNQSNGTLTISVDNMPKGVYYVTLNVDGAVADTKSLIIR